MRADESTYQFIRSAAIEGEKLKAYKCTAGKWTIGPGLCYYPDGRAVKQGDAITQTQSREMFFGRAPEFEKDVNANLTKTLTQKQWNVLFSIAWNYGTGWYSASRLIVKQFNKNPKDFKEIERIFSLMDNRNRRMNELKYLKTP
jgi:GH24 family phage-related lysozyme (muramidase)